MQKCLNHLYSCTLAKDAASKVLVCSCRQLIIALRARPYELLLVSELYSCPNQAKYFLNSRAKFNVYINIIFST